MLGKSSCVKSCWNVSTLLICTYVHLNACLSLVHSQFKHIYLSIYIHCMHRSVSRYVCLLCNPNLYRCLCIHKFVSISVTILVNFVNTSVNLYMYTYIYICIYMIYSYFLCITLLLSINVVAAHNASVSLHLLFIYVCNCLHL